MKKKIINVLFTVSFAFYALFLLWNILFKYVSPLELFSSSRYFSRSLNLIPFNDIIQGYYNSLDVWGNVILFVPLGIYFGLLFKGSKTYKSIIYMAGISFFFELFQYICAIGASDVTDIITNTLGGVMGILVYYIIKKIFKEDRKVKNFVSISSFIVMVPVSVIIVALFIFN